MLRGRPNALLLDVDGVVYRNRVILDKVSQNVVKYVSQELHTDLDTAKKINNMLYGTFGHTYTGMRATYGMNKSMAHFTRHVYTDELLHAVSSNANDHIMINDSIAVRSLAEECKRKDIELFLFSNAPFTWCSRILSVMQLDRYVSTENIISSDHDLLCSRVKPDPHAYDNVYKYIMHKYHDDVVCMMVDDSFINLAPLLGVPHWRPVFVNNMNDLTMTTKWLDTIHNLAELHTRL